MGAPLWPLGLYTPPSPSPVPPKLNLFLSSLQCKGVKMAKAEGKVALLPMPIPI